MKQRLIIFDGPDGCGKTEISRALSKELGITYFKNYDEHKHFENNPEYFAIALEYVCSYFTSYLQQSGASMIFDRYWPSEWVYSQLLNRDTSMETLKELDSQYAKMGTVIVVPYRTDYTQVKDTYNVITSQILELDDLYKEFCEWTQCKVIRLCVDTEDLELQLGTILANLQEQL